MATVLVIDDDAPVRQTVGRMLRGAGHVVIEAEDGAIGLEAIRRDKPDLVITDIVMPNQEGIETIAMIREMSDVPIIAVSGSVTNTYDPLSDARKFGANLTLAKPFRGGELLAAIKQLLGPA